MSYAGHSSDAPVRLTMSGGHDQDVYDASNSNAAFVRLSEKNIYERFVIHEHRDDDVQAARGNAIAAAIAFARAACKINLESEFFATNDSLQSKLRSDKRQMPWSY